MKADIHPEYVLSTVHCSCGNYVRDPFDEARAARRDLLAVPPVLHGQAEARRHGRPRRALPAAAREGRPRLSQRVRRRRARLLAMAQAIGGQAVLEGVMMRGPRNWAVAVRKPDGEIAQVCARDRPADGAPLGAAPAGRPRRRRARRVARDRLPRAVGLGQLRRRRRRSEGDERAGRDRPLGALLLVRGRDRLRARRSSRSARRCSPTRCRSRAAAGSSIVEGLIRVTVFVALPRPAQPDPVAAARVPVPRRRAQGDQRLRGRRGADAGDGAALLADPPALRHGVPALGDGDRRLRLRVLRPAALVLADRHADRAAAGDRRDRVRADPLRRQARRQPRPDDAARARASGCSD